MEIICISHQISQIPRISDAFDYCKPPSGQIKAERLYLLLLSLLLSLLLLLLLLLSLILLLIIIIIIIIIFLPEKNFSKGYCFQLRLWFCFIHLFILFYFFIFLDACGHDNSWKAQPIRTKFSHMTFDWNSSAKFKNGHLCPSEN